MSDTKGQNSVLEKINYDQPIKFCRFRNICILQHVYPLRGVKTPRAVGPPHKDCVIQVSIGEHREKGETRKLGLHAKSSVNTCGTTVAQGTHGDTS